MFVEMAKKRRHAFDHLNSYLDLIKRIAKTEDKNSRVFLFGSVEKGDYNMASDIDILIVTEKDRYILLTKLENEGIEFPFELHVRNSREAEAYFQHIPELKEL